MVNSNTNSIENEEFLNKYVIVKYDGVHYVGLVLKVKGCEFQVKTMLHDKNKDEFFWPSKKDICWYYKGDILEIIPKLKQLGKNRFKVEK